METVWLGLGNKITWLGLGKDCGLNPSNYSPYVTWCTSHDRSQTRNVSLLGESPASTLPCVDFLALHTSPVMITTATIIHLFFFSSWGRAESGYAKNKKNKNRFGLASWTGPNCLASVGVTFGRVPDAPRLGQSYPPRLRWSWTCSAYSQDVAFLWGQRIIEDNGWTG